jgi:hypothetical protein
MHACVDVREVNVKRVTHTHTHREREREREREIVSNLFVC